MTESGTPWMPRPSQQNETAGKSLRGSLRQERGDKAGGRIGRARLEPFWKRKSLEELNHTEWESLCDGCGRCCLVKLEDEDSGKIHFTDIACRLFDKGACRCADYKNRRRKVRDCIKLTPAKVRALGWLPPSCAYRLVAEGRDLPWWHPLVSGSAKTVHEAGVSVQGRVQRSEKDVKLADYIHHIVSWPGKRPSAVRPKPGKAAG